jgi:hypothetical protein
MKKIILIVCAVLLSGSNIIKAETQAQLFGQSALIWRGYVSTNKPTITPSITFKKSGFQAEFWSAMASDGSYREFDFILGYQYKNFKISMFDYYLPQNDVKNKFFDFEASPDMRHDVELVAEYKISDKFPLTVMVANNILGDYDEVKDPKCEERYSTYIEFNYQFTTEFCNYKTRVGLTPAEGYYGDDFGLVNVAAEAYNDIKFDKFTIPWKIQLIYSDVSEDLYFVGGIGIKL